MDEIAVKNRIKAAFLDIKTPEKLLEATIERGKTIESGRKAEQRLSSSFAEGEKEQLVAEALVGRMAQNRMVPPPGISRETVIHQLKKLETFQKFASLPAAAILDSIANGTALEKMTQEPKRAISSAAKQMNIEKQTPAKGGPS